MTWGEMWNADLDQFLIALDKQVIISSITLHFYDTNSLFVCIMKFQEAKERVDNDIQIKKLGSAATGGRKKAGTVLTKV